MSGSFVSIPSNNVALDDMSSEILNTITYTREYADEMRDMLLDSVEDLKDMVAGYNPPSIEDVDTSVAEIDRPVMPTAPTLEDFSSCIFETLCNKIKNDIINGGTGLTEPVYNAIIARELEARRINQDREYRKALDSVGSQGFNLPSGNVAALQAEIIREILQRDQDALNLTIVKDFDLATDNTRFAVTTAVEIEKILLQGWDSAEKNKVEVYKASVDGVVGQYRALTDWVKAKVEVIKMEVTAAISEGKLSLDAYNAMTQLSERITEAITNVAAQSVASALGAINTSMSNSYSGSEGRSESWGHSEGLSESHGYTHST